MLGEGALRSRAHALAITGVLALGVFAAIVLAAGVPGAPARATSARAAHPAIATNDAAARRASLPLYFEPNVGQSDPHVRFLSQSGRYTLFLTDEGAVFSLVGGEIHKGPKLATVNPPRQPQPDRLVQSAVRIRMAGANRHPEMTALEPLPGRVNYLIGNDPSKFHRGVPTYGRVKVSDVYPGIDVVYYGMPTSLEYDIVAAPGADTSRIHLAIEGGAKSAIDASGDIEISTAAGTVAVQKPRAYQRAKDGSEIPVASSFVAAQGPKTAPPEYSIQLASYDHTRPLIIDPTVQILLLELPRRSRGECRTSEPRAIRWALRATSLCPESPTLAPTWRSIPRTRHTSLVSRTRARAAFRSSTPSRAPKAALIRRPTKTRSVSSQNSIRPNRRPRL